MLVRRTLKRYKKTGNIENQPGQGRSRSAKTSKSIKATIENIQKNPKKCIQNLSKRENVSHWIIFTVLYKNLKMSLFWNMKKQLLLAKAVKKRFVRARIILSCIEKGTLPNLTFSDKKKFDVKQSTTLTSRMSMFGLAMVKLELKDKRRRQWWYEPLLPNLEGVY